MPPNAWKCERCGKVTTFGDDDGLPDGWRYLTIGVRGAADVTNRKGVDVEKMVCGSCDDALYDWFYDPEEDR